MKKILLFIIVIMFTTWIYANDYNDLKINTYTAKTEMMVNGMVYIGNISSISKGSKTIVFNAVNAVRVEKKDNEYVYFNSEKSLVDKNWNIIIK